MAITVQTEPEQENTRPNNKKKLQQQTPAAAAGTTKNRKTPIRTPAFRINR